MLFMVNILNVMVKLQKLQNGQKKSLVFLLLQLKHLQNILQKFLIIMAGAVYLYCRLAASKEIQKVSKVLEHLLFLLVY